MIFRSILNHAEPFALDLDTKPWAVSVRAQVIASFVALGLGKGGLFISTFLFAMVWLDASYLPYAIACTTVTLLVMVIGYIAAFGRIQVHIDAENGHVHLTRRAPFYRRTVSEPLGNYQGIALDTQTDGNGRTIHTLLLAHEDAERSAPLWQRRRPEPPQDEWQAYAQALNVPSLD